MLPTAGIKTTFAKCLIKFQDGKLVNLNLFLM